MESIGAILQNLLAESPEKPLSERLQAVAERISAEAEMTPEERQRAGKERAQTQCDKYNSTPGKLKDGYYISTIQSDSTFVEGDGYDCELCMNRGDTLHIRETPTGFYHYSVPCKCMEIRRSIWRMKRSGLENSIREYTFKRFTVEEQWQQKMVDMAHRYLAEGVQAGRWLYIGGQPGCGKTHICTAVAGKLLYEMPVIYAVWPQISKKLKALVNDAEDYGNEVGKLQEIDVLYFDDFFKPVTDGNGKWPLFWVLDCESQWGIKDNQAAPIARIFEDELRRLAIEQGPGDIRVALYVAQEKYKDWSFDYSHFAYVWIPGYGDKYKPPMPCDMWQYASKGTLPGISGNVDLNKLMGTKPLSFFIAPTEPTTPTEPTDTDGGEITMFTGKQLAEYCEKMYANKSHWAYWYGTYGNKCTLSKYESKSKQYSYPKYSHYAPSRKSGYMKDIDQGRRCADCVGMIKSFFWTGNQYDTDPKYGTNGCPDKSANGMIDLCKVTGAISTIPDIPGVVVWTNGHIGVYIGGGYTIEMRGFDYDCVKRKVTAGPWKKWGKLPMLSYEDAPVPEPTKLGDRDLKKGCEGEDVKDLQNGLMKLGYALPNYGADGDFGSETEKAVKQFQLAHSLPDDGVMNVGTDFDALFKALDGDTPQKYGNVEITGGSINVRSAPGYDSKVYGTAHKGDILPYQGVTQEAEGKPWYLVIWKNQNAWVSSKYARLVK